MIHIAIPAMDEPDLPRLLLDLNAQHLLPQSVCVCINQPSSYYTDGLPEHRRICEVNQSVYRQLRRLESEGRFAFPLEIIDCFSPEKAWDAKHSGVGRARKTAMDFLSRRFGKEASALLVCMDADTRYPPDYLQNVRRQFVLYPEAVALANPYYHFVDVEDRPAACAMLHYEVYMRAYALCLRLCKLPYAFTAIGSSMACRMEAYRKIGGITPFKSGEDFYFLQKMNKTGAVLTHSLSVSHPSARLSHRVGFGTGPALQKGLDNHWESYPIYPFYLFETMRAAYAGLPTLFEKGQPCREMAYWNRNFGEGWWIPLKKNSGNRPGQFVHACTEKFDALRGFQFLKASYRQSDKGDFANLSDLYGRLRKTLGRINNREDFSISASGQEPSAFFDAGYTDSLFKNPAKAALSDLTLQDWMQIRDFLFLCERHLQKNQALLPSW